MMDEIDSAQVKVKTISTPKRIVTVLWRDSIDLFDSQTILSVFISMEHLELCGFVNNHMLTHKVDNLMINIKRSF